MLESGGQVPLLDLGAQHAPLREALDAAFLRVLDSGHFILGPELDALERELCAFLKVPHALGVSSGTDALLASLMALGIGPGDEVITTPFSFFATAGCIARLGARPVFADIDPATFNLDPAQVEARITPRTRAVIVVHLFGRPCEMRPFLALSARHGFAILEDVAQALGANTDAGPVGAVGATGSFSFFPSKNLGALGDGGLITTSDAGLADTLRKLRAHGAEPKYHHLLLGGNFRLDGLQAALLRVKLPHVDAWTRGRRKNAAQYHAHLTAAGLPAERLAPPAPHPEHVFHQYVVRSDRRDALRDGLAARGIGSAVYYPEPLHLQPCFAQLGHVAGDFPHAERACREVLALPIYAELAEAQLERVARSVLELSAA
jgi:dTDP-4-amino-4,6-dideoxygalactose transaminase